jgi:hypothetical protein
MDYLESVGLMDKPMLDINAIRHLVHNIQDRYDQVVRRLWTEKQYQLIERFIHMHKPCGLYARLALTPEEDDDPKEESPSSYIVKGVPEKNTSEKIPELRLVRGRR